MKNRALHYWREKMSAQSVINAEKKSRGGTGRQIRDTAGDPSHPTHGLFALRRHQNICATTSRLQFLP
ncbi:putative ring-cleaving dioxygenase MhqA [Clarias magur]|uniref:Putative ring-cleaving dioxygenase MhqA n=1 Tax=Clarias magur TaxID=1594786 RepID=A0A8J4U7W0_CLAMG|nr:putative ring-cleaving dioxygenase MhqA [Clarias magur]